MHSCRDLFKKLNVLTLASLFIYELCTHAFNCKDSYPKNSDYHGYNTRVKNNFHVPLNKYLVSYKSPLSLAARTFNILPTNIKDSKNINQFRFKLKEFLIEKSYYNIDEYMANYN